MEIEIRDPPKRGTVGANTDGCDPFIGQQNKTTTTDSSIAKMDENYLDHIQCNIQGLDGYPLSALMTCGGRQIRNKNKTNREDYYDDY